MYICPNCHKTYDTPTNFCSVCGCAVQPDGAVAPVYTAPVYAGPSKGKMITGMILGISGVVFASLGLLYTLLFMGIEGTMAFAFGLVFSLISMPLSLVGMILSRGCAAQGGSNGMISTGKITGMIGTILSAAMLFLAFIALLSEM